MGADLGNQVSTRYKGPNPFQGKLGKVTIDVDTSKVNPVEMLRFLSQMGLNV